VTPLAVCAAILIGLLLLDVIGACALGIGATGILWRLFLFEAPRQPVHRRAG